MPWFLGKQGANHKSEPNDFPNPPQRCKYKVNMNQTGFPSERCPTPCANFQPTLEIPRPRKQKQCKVSSEILKQKQGTKDYANGNPPSASASYPCWVVLDGQSNNLAPINPDNCTIPVSKGKRVFTVQKPGVKRCQKRVLSIGQPNI